MMHGPHFNTIASPNPSDNEDISTSCNMELHLQRVVIKNRRQVGKRVQDPSYGRKSRGS